MLWTAEERRSDTNLGYPSLVTKDFAASMQASVPLNGVVGVMVLLFDDMGGVQCVPLVPGWYIQ
jgi:hypothetical protein